MSSDSFSSPAYLHSNLVLFGYSFWVMNSTLYASLSWYMFFFPSCVLKLWLRNYCNSYIGNNSLSVFSYKGRKLME